MNWWALNAQFYLAWVQANFGEDLLMKMQNKTATKILKPLVFCRINPKF